MQYGLIGKVLVHSYSKQIHEALRPASYELVELKEEEVHDFLMRRDFIGMNVTIPYKQLVMQDLDEIDAAAKKIGAVNTIVNDHGKLIGYNTDYYGFRSTLTHFHIDAAGKKALVIGNGGASKAVIAALSDLGVKEQYIVKYKEEAGCITYAEAARDHSDAELIVNTSPVGMYPNVDASPMDLSPYHNLTAVVDLIYNPSVTRLMQQAADMGAKTAGGLWMLVEQARRASELFYHDTLPETCTKEIAEQLMRGL